MIFDQYGFAHTADASAPAQILNIGIGKTAGELVNSNSYLRNVVPQLFRELTSPKDGLLCVCQT